MAGEVSKPLVSVVCATYNRKALLQCALRSVLNQDFRDFEIQVMGDGCTDGTEEIIAQLNDPRLRWFNFPKNTGSQTEPNNEGIRRAQGRYIAYMGHDDLWMPWHLSRLVEQIETSRVDFVHDFLVSIGLNGVENVYGPPYGAMNYEHVHFPPGSWLHRRALVEEVGYWRNPNDLSCSMDLDFKNRMVRAGKRFGFVSSLGILKFHSVTWRSYTLKGAPPQEPYLKSILENPQQLNTKLLLDLARLFSRHTQWGEKKPLNLAWNETKLAAKDTMKACFREMIDWYGPERWPVKALLRRRMRGLRSRQRVVRGLPSLEESGL